MGKANKWRGGQMHLKLPTLPQQYRGQSGAMFETTCLDETVGDEVILVILDDPQYSREIAALSPFNLFAKTGAIRTNAGLIAFIIWSVFNDRQHMVDYEHPINPFNQKLMSMISSLSQQSHLKVFPVDSVSAESVGFFEFDNVFGFDQLAGGLAQVIEHEPPADFTATQAALREEFSLEDLKSL